MARVRHPNLQNAGGRYLAGHTVTAVTDRTDDSPAAAYTTEEGATTVTYPVTSGAEGQVDIWVEPGSYESSFGDDTVDEPAVWEAIVGVDSGEVADAIAALESAAAAYDGPYLDVKVMYGAIGNGIADDTTAIQDAIDDAKSGSGTVYLPVGVYKITETLECGDNTRGYRIRGAAWASGNQSGEGSVLSWQGDDADPMVSAQRVSGGFEFDHLRLEYTSATYTGDLVKVWGSTTDAINWHLHHISSRGINSDTARSIIYLRRAIIGRVEHFQLASADQIIRVDDSLFFNNAYIGHGTFNHANDCFIFLGSADTQNVTIDDITFEAGNSGAAAIRGGSVAEGDSVNNAMYGLKVTNCWFGDVGATVSVFRDLRGISNLRFLTFQGNTIFGTSTTTIFDNCFGNFNLIANEFVGGTLFTGANIVNLNMVGNFATLDTAVFDSTTPDLVNTVGNLFQGSPKIPYPKHMASPIWVGNRGGGGALSSAITDPDGAVVIGHNAAVIDLDNTAGVYAVMSGSNPTRLILQAPADNDARTVELVAGTTPATKLSADGTGIAFNGQSPAARPDYTVTNPSTDRALDVSADTTAQVAAVLGTLIADLIAVGLLQ